MTLLIIDGPNLMMRSLYAAVGSDMSASGVATGAFTLFVNALAKHVREEAADQVVVCWEGDHGTRSRREALPAYKANRQQGTSSVAGPDVACQGLILEFLDLCGITSRARADMEADDLIAALWSHASAPLTDRIVILSSDKDMLQLVGPNPFGVPTEQVRLGSHRVETDRWDVERVTEHYGVPPHALPGLLALMGDAADGIKGVPRIGPKRGAKLLAEHDFDIDRAVPPESEHRALVELNLYLIDLRVTQQYEMPPGRFEPPAPGRGRWSHLIEFCDRWSMIKLKNRLLTGQLWAPGQDMPRGRPIGLRPGKTST